MKAWRGALVGVVFLLSCVAPPPAEVDAGPPLRLLRSGIEVANFDPVVRLQDNLFRGVNGTWLSKTEIPAEAASYGAGEKLIDESELNLRTLIEVTAKSAGSRRGTEAQQVGDLYTSFMNTARVDAQGFKPIEPELARIDALKTKDELPRLLAHQVELDVTTPVQLSVHQDNKNSTDARLMLAQGGLGLPDRDYYVSRDEKFVALRKAYAAYAGHNLALLKVKDAAKQGEAILVLETKLASVQWATVDTRDVGKTFNQLAVPALQKLTPGFDWAQVFAGLGVNVASVVVSEPSYFVALATVLKTTPLSVWKAYFKHHLVMHFSPYLSQDFVDAHFAFVGTTLNGVPENRPRWKRGVQVVNDLLGEAAGKLYVARHFPPENKARMQALVENLLEAYRQSIGASEWMSLATKRAALVKLTKIVSKVGFPDRWRDYSTLELQNDDLVGNVQRATAFDVHRLLNKLGKPIDRGEWSLSPQLVNAQYNPELNDITFPAAILQPPFFDMNADDAVNYGAIGAVIGHEISHGFDDQGSKYDGDGNLNDWWTEADRAKFEARSKALVAQYDAYEPLKGFHVNGALTLGENIADLAGLSIAFKAYQLSLQGKPSPRIDGLSGEQRVFIGYAQVCAEKLREEALLKALTSDEHTPGEFRANGVVVNLRAFYDAFGVMEGDGMFRPEAARTTIW